MIVCAIIGALSDSATPAYVALPYILQGKGMAPRSPSRVDLGDDPFEV